MKQLSAIALECHSILNLFLIQHRHCNKKIYEINSNPDPSTSIIDVSIDEILISRIQVDAGFNVNLMNANIMKALDLIKLMLIILKLKMIDHSCVKSMNILRNIQIAIVDIVYEIDYIVFWLQSLSLFYSNLLERLWLFQAKAKNDWGRSILILEKGSSKIILQMYPIQYHGESQIAQFKITSDDEYSFD